MKNTKLEYDPISVRWMGYHTELKKFLEDTAGLPKVPRNEKENEGKNLKVVYATPSSAFTKYVIPMVNGLTQYPIISFYLSSEETLDEVSGNGISTYEFYSTDENHNVTKISFNRPVMKRLTYTCNLFATKMADCDYMLTLLEGNCNKFKPYSCKVNGRPAQYYLDNVESEAPEYEGKKFNRSQFMITVPRAMVFPVEVETNDNVIKRINAYLYGEEDLIDTEIIIPKEE